MIKKKIGQIKSNNHGFDLWLFEVLLYEVVRLENVKGFNNLIDSNPDLADEYFEKRIKKMGKIKLPAKYNTKEWEEKMLSEIYRKYGEEKRELKIHIFASFMKKWL